jgi:uncharacterized protein
MQINPGANLLLNGVVGSTAFGLNHSGSDKDYQGIFVAPTETFLGLETKFQESYSYKNPDTTYHEVGKFCRLALGCNPTVLDLLWLDVYNVRTVLGIELINLRSNFLSAPTVKGAYFGYANDQYAKLLKDDREDKRAKNARHFLRLLHQGSKLYLTGKLSVKLNNPQYYIDCGRAIAQGQLHLAKRELEIAEAMFSETSALPEKPNKELINEWLLKVRHAFL